MTARSPFIPSARPSTAPNKFRKEAKQMTDCPHCKKTFARALEDFSGRWHCPSCLESLFPTENTELLVTPASNAGFIRSERLFKQGWLLGKSEDIGFSDATVALSEAITQCRLAASQGNPYALVSLASYYESGYAEPGESKRWNTALMCNRAVALNNHPFKVNNGTATRHFTDIETDTIKFEAAVNILRLFRNVPGVIAGRVDAIRRELLPLINSVCSDIVSHKTVPVTDSVYAEYMAITRKKEDKAASAQEFAASDLMRAISHMTDPHQPPIFFLAYMSGREITPLPDLAVPSQSVKKQKTLTKFCSDNGILVTAIEARNKNEAIDSEGFENFFTMVNEQRIDADKMYFVFVFNRNAKTSKVKSSFLNRIYSAFKNDGNEMLRTFIDINAYNDYIFYEDDLRLISSASPKGTLEKLADKIREA